MRDDREPKDDIDIAEGHILSHRKTQHSDSKVAVSSELTICRARI